MKFARKAFSLLLALALMLSLALPVMADESNAAATPATYAVTIKGAKSGHTYNAYQIFSGSLDTTGAILSNINWGSGIKGEDFLADLKASDDFAGGTGVANVFAACSSANDVAGVLNGYSDNDKLLDYFAKLAGKHLNTSAGSSEVSGENYSITGLPAGYYLVKDMQQNGVLDNDYYSKFMLEVAGNVDVFVKGDVPTINKTTSNQVDQNYGESVSTMIGTKVYFELTASLPSNFELYDDYYLTFTDTMSKGLDFVEIEKVYIKRSTGEVEIPAQFVDFDLRDEAITGEDSVYVTDAGEGKTSFQVKVGDLKADGFPDLLVENKIVVRYSAKLNNDAVIGQTGNLNIVDLNFSNNPYGDGEGKTGPDEALVFTFGIDVDKHNKLNADEKLNGAEFVLYRRQVEPDNTLTLNFVVAENGVFKEWLPVTGVVQGATTASTWENVKAELTEAELAKITLTTTAGGEIKIAGLDVHTYHLLETKAPDGYNLPHDPVIISMASDKDSNNNINMTYQVDSGAVKNPNQGFAEVSIGNGKGNTLPSTGGMGTTLFYVIGGLLVVSAAVLLITKKRMSEV